MSRGRAAGLALAGAALVVVGVALVWLVASGDETFAELRQTSSQPIPGTLGLTLEPPEGAEPIMGPDPAIERARVPEDGQVHVTLATIHDRFEGTDIGPAWVVFARGVCLRNEKGELVSNARGEVPGEGLECTDATMWVLAVDAGDGDLLLTTTAYDDTLAWRPEVAGPAAA